MKTRRICGRTEISRVPTPTGGDDRAGHRVPLRKLNPALRASVRSWGRRTTRGATRAERTAGCVSEMHCVSPARGRRVEAMDNDESAAIEDELTAALERSFAGWVFRVLGSLLLAGGLVVAIFVIVMAVEEGATFPSAFLVLAGILVPAAAGVVVGLVLIAVAQVADALVTTALYTKRNYTRTRDPGVAVHAQPGSIERRIAQRPPRVPCGGRALSRRTSCFAKARLGRGDRFRSGGCLRPRADRAGETHRIGAGASSTGRAAARLPRSARPRRRGRARRRTTAGAPDVPRRTIRDRGAPGHERR